MKAVKLKEILPRFQKDKDLNLGERVMEARLVWSVASRRSKVSKVVCHGLPTLPYLSGWSSSWVVTDTSFGGGRRGRGLPGLCDHYTEGGDSSVYSPGLGKQLQVLDRAVVFDGRPDTGPSVRGRGTESIGWYGKRQGLGLRWGLSS